MTNNTSNNFSAEQAATELSDDMVMVSPGVMLKEAREKLSLTQEDIAQRLNLKPSLVDSMERDYFDPSLPVPFNRGYLCSYAKVVSVDTVDILASYDALGAAQTQRSELQSFSKQTIKEAEHSRVMWLSYLIIAILVGLTILWWLQESRQKEPIPANVSVESIVPNKSAAKVIVETTTIPSSVIADSDTNTSVDDVITTDLESDNTSVNTVDDKVNITESNQVNTAAEQSDNINNAADLPMVSNETINTYLVDSMVVLDKAVFTFSGDCWVNIYDATGERVAWGVKKSGYVMTVEGKAPLRVTLGKPELASIVYNEQVIDMSAFSAGNISKFTLPLSTE
jgi:cytoskeleton protein RodZ